MRFVLIACAVAACATPRAVTRAGDDAVITLDPIEPVAAYLEDTRPPASGGADPARIRVEVVEIAVLPTRPDGAQWDGGRLPDDAAQTRLTEALAAPDAGRHVPRLLRALTIGSAAPDLAGEISIGDTRVALTTVADAAVRPGAALPPVALTPDTTLLIRLVDQDDAGDQPVGEVVIERDALLDALRAGAPVVLDLRGAGTGAILFVTLRVTPA